MPDEFDDLESEFPKSAFIDGDLTDDSDGMPDEPDEIESEGGIPGEEDEEDLE